MNKLLLLPFEPCVQQPLPFIQKVRPFTFVSNPLPGFQFLFEEGTFKSFRAVSLVNLRQQRLPASLSFDEAPLFGLAYLTAFSRRALNEVVCLLELV